jgi:bis(5'-nucleosyl)-tetraphosphatase (symmetrical)
MDFLIGDVQGCDDALARLLDRIGFSPSRDHAVLLGDLVNRGPQSLAVLRRVHAMGAAVSCLLGNHDLHLLAVAHGVRRAHRSDTLDDILQAPDRDAWIDWLRTRPLALMRQGWLCVHAGVVPAWDARQTLGLAAEVQALLAGPDLPGFLQVMYGNTPARWDPGLRGADRWRFVINVLTRIRLCTPDGSLDFATKGPPDTAPPGHRPWFDMPGRRSAGQPIAFGHWSTLGLLQRSDLLGLDTGCLWGGALTAVRVDGGRREVLQVACPRQRQPGA